MPHHALDPAKPGPNAHLVVTQRLSRLVDQQWKLAFCRVLAQRTVPDRRTDNYRRAELAREFEGLRVIEVGTYLRQVGPVEGARVQVNPEVGLGHDFPDERVGGARGDGPFGAARERAVQVAPIRQVARALEKAVHIHDRHCEQRAAQ